MKKKIIAILMSCLMVTSLVACGGEDKPSEPDKKPAAEEQNPEENAKLTKEDLPVLIEQIYNEVKPKIESEDIDFILASDKNSIKFTKKGSLNSDDTFMYKGQKNYGGKIRINEINPEIVFEGSMQFELEDIKSGKANVDITKTILPEIISAIDKSNPDVAQYNQEISEEIKRRTEENSLYNFYKSVDVNGMKLDISAEEWTGKINVGIKLRVSNKY